MAKNPLFKGEFRFLHGALFYYSALEELEKIPHRLDVTGTWELDRNKNLRLRVVKSLTKVFGDTLTFTTQVTQAKAQSLRLTLLDRLTPSGRNVKRVELKGRWKVDERNNLIFTVTRSNQGELNFGSSWHVTKRNTLACIYRQRQGKRTLTRSFALKGAWKFDRGRVTFHVGGTGVSPLNFHVQGERNVLVLKQDSLQFRVGARYGRKGKRVRKKTVTLWGAWTIQGTDVVFTFEESRQSHSLRFRFVKKLSRRGSVQFELVSKHDKPLGYHVTLSHKIGQGGRLFIKGKYGREKSLEGGFSLPW